MSPSAAAVLAPAGGGEAVPASVLLLAAEEELEAAVTLGGLLPRQAVPHLRASLSYALGASGRGTVPVRFRALADELRIKEGILSGDPTFYPAPGYVEEVASVVAACVEDVRSSWPSPGVDLP